MSVEPKEKKRYLFKEITENECDSFSGITGIN